MAFAVDLHAAELTSMMSFFDTHAHLDFPEFAADLPALVDRANVAGITRIITIGCDLDSSRRAVAVAELYPTVFASVGWHPCYVEHAPEDFRTELRDLARHPKVVAIGECGLDHYRLPSGEAGSGKTAEDDERYRQKQGGVFQQQLEVAAELGLNCIIHQRAAFAPTIELLRPWSGRLRTVFHCFVGTPEEVRLVGGLNGLVSFTGILTFKNAAAVRAALAAAAPDGFMLETDCPYLAPVPHRGKRCEPAFVADLAKVAAEVRGCSLEELSGATCATARRFFPKMG